MKIIIRIENPFLHLKTRSKVKKQGKIHTHGMRINIKTYLQL